MNRAEFTSKTSCGSSLPPQRKDQLVDFVAQFFGGGITENIVQGAYAVCVAAGGANSTVDLGLAHFTGGTAATVAATRDVEGEPHVRSIKAHAHGGRLAAIASDEAHWLLSGWELVSNCPSTTKTAQAVARETQSLRFEAPHFAF